MVIPGDDFQVRADHRAIQGGRSLADAAAVGLHRLVASNGTGGEVAQRAGSGVAGGAVKGEGGARLQNRAVHGFQGQLHVVVAVSGVGGVSTEGAQLLHMGSYIRFGLVEFHYLGGDLYGADFILFQDGYHVLIEFVVIYTEAVFAVLIDEFPGRIHGDNGSVHRLLLDTGGKLIQFGLDVVVGNLRLQGEILFRGFCRAGRTGGAVGRSGFAVLHGLFQYRHEIIGKGQILVGDFRRLVLISNGYFIGARQGILRLLELAQGLNFGQAGHIHSAHGNPIGINLLRRFRRGGTIRRTGGGRAG